jgi:Tfp pilus assembly protein PilX
MNCDQRRGKNMTQSGPVRGGQRGAALLSVLLMMLMLAVITATVMTVVQSDVTAGVKQQQAVQVFNIAEAGIHYAVARLSSAGAATYAGETISVQDGGTTLGTTVIAVQCLNGTSPAGTSCTGADPAFRRIRSTATLPAAGPARVVTAIVQGTTSSTGTYAICGYDGVSFDRGTTVYGDVGSNAAISLAMSATPSRICNSLAGGACAAPSPAPPLPYSGSAYAVSTITCGGGACGSGSIEGTIAPNQPAGSVCPVVTLTPPSPPGTTPLTVAAGTTVTVDPNTNYDAVRLNSPGGGSGCPPVANVATLVIDSGADPNATVTVRMRSLYVGRCGRVVITGVGKVALWLLEPATIPAANAGQALHTEQQAVFGSTTTGSTPSAIAGGRFTINVTSSKPNDDAGNCLSGAATCGAVHFNQAGLVAGTFVIPEGGYKMDQAQLTNGAILAKRIHFDRDTTFYYDPTSSTGGGTYSNFNTLKYWKDQ